MMPMILGVIMMTLMAMTMMMMTHLLGRSGRPGLGSCQINPEFELLPDSNRAWRRRRRIAMATNILFILIQNTHIYKYKCKYGKGS